MVTSATPDHYTEAIHFENQTENIDVFDNYVTLGHEGSDYKEIAGIGLVNFTDHGATASFDWSVKNILVGWGNRVDRKYANANGIGVKAHNVQNCRFNYLDMSKMTSPAQPYAFATVTADGWFKPQDYSKFTYTQVGNNPAIQF